MGVLQGAGTGAAIGSVIPGIGTAAGAIAGGIIGLGQTIGGWFSGVVHSAVPLTLTYCTCSASPIH